MKNLILIFLIFKVLFISNVYSLGDADLVTDDIGLNFNKNFKVYSGYLNGSTDGKLRLHYMLTESKNDPDNSPLLFWFNGGPGCSSFSGSFEELGPFYIDSNNSTLYENVYSWNEHANVVYLESPAGTGFSYNTDNPSDYKANDSYSLSQNFNALKDFFNNVQPKYKNKEFYLSGESYAGIYLPMLGAAIADAGDDFPAKLKGIAIGNGFMHVQMLTNSLILWSNYHGRLSLDEWETLKQKDCCNRKDGEDVDSCDWTQNLKTTNNIDYVGDTSTKCGKILNNIVNATGLFNIDPYNYYEDCYKAKFITKLQDPNYYLHGKRLQLDLNNPASLINRDSTDFLWGYPCSQETYVAGYFNKRNIQKAFHIDQKWQDANITFSDCNNDLYNHYNLTYNNMFSQFDTMIQNLSDFRILIYNGDVDTVCNYLGDAKFINQVADNNDFNHTDRIRWYFRNQLAGFYQTYTGGNNFRIDVLTVKGAGHMVPLDRPGPSLQMITNFILSDKPNYNNSNTIDTVPKPANLITPTANPSQSTTSGVKSQFLNVFFFISFIIFMIFNN